MGLRRLGVRRSCRKPSTRTLTTSGPAASIVSPTTGLARHRPAPLARCYRMGGEVPGPGYAKSKGETMGHLMMPPPAAACSHCSSCTSPLYSSSRWRLRDLQEGRSQRGSGLVGLRSDLQLHHHAEGGGPAPLVGRFLLLPIIPFLGSLALLVISIIVLNDVSKSFGHGVDSPWDSCSCR